MPDWNPEHWSNFFPQRSVIWPAQPNDLGKIDMLIAQSVTHVVVADASYRNLVSEFEVPQSERDSFYAELVQRAKIVWREPRGRVIYLAPGFTIYALK